MGCGNVISNLLMLALLLLIGNSAKEIVWYVTCCLQLDLSVHCSLFSRRYRDVLLTI
jgi:hypothetical protein